MNPSFTRWTATYTLEAGKYQIYLSPNSKQVLHQFYITKPTKKNNSLTRPWWANKINPKRHARPNQLFKIPLEQLLHIICVISSPKNYECLCIAKIAKQSIERFERYLHIRERPSTTRAAAWCWSDDSPHQRVNFTKSNPWWVIGDCGIGMCSCLDECIRADSIMVGGHRLDGQTTYRAQWSHNFIIRIKKKLGAHSKRGFGFTLEYHIVYNYTRGFNVM